MFKKRSSLEEHCKSVHEKIRNHKCDQCNKTFALKCNLNKHIKNVHENVKDHKCDICNEIYKSKRNLRYHVETIHEGKKRPCEKCGKLYTSKSLQVHIRKYCL